MATAAFGAALDQTNSLSVSDVLGLINFNYFFNSLGFLPSLQ